MEFLSETWPKLRETQRFLDESQVISSLKVASPSRFDRLGDLSPRPRRGGSALREDLRRLRSVVYCIVDMRYATHEVLITSLNHKLIYQLN